MPSSSTPVRTRRSRVSPSDAMDPSHPVSAPLGSLADLGQGKPDPADLTFVPEPTPADQLQFLVKAGLLKGSPQGHIDFATNPALGHRPCLRAGSGNWERAIFFFIKSDLCFLEKIKRIRRQRCPPPASADSGHHTPHPNTFCPVCWLLVWAEKSRFSLCIRVIGAHCQKSR